MSVLKLSGCALAFGLLPSIALADFSEFHPGEAIPEFGPIADVPDAIPLPEGVVLKHSFDLSRAAPAGRISRDLESAARFINMHYAVGVPMENIDAAVVIHGEAVFDVTKAEFYRSRKDDAANVNIGLVEALLEAGVRIIVCGQSATAQDVYRDNLLPGVELALSAMTAHALLQQEGYTLNPF